MRFPACDFSHLFSCFLRLVLCFNLHLHCVFLHATKSAPYGLYDLSYIHKMKFSTEKQKKVHFFTSKNVQQIYKDREINKFWATVGKGANVYTQRKSRFSNRFMAP